MELLALPAADLEDPLHRQCRSEEFDIVVFQHVMAEQHEKIMWRLTRDLLHDTPPPAVQTAATGGVDVLQNVSHSRGQQEDNLDPSRGSARRPEAGRGAGCDEDFVELDVNADCALEGAEEAAHIPQPLLVDSAVQNEELSGGRGRQGATAAGINLHHGMGVADNAGTCKDTMMIIKMMMMMIIIK